MPVPRQLFRSATAFPMAGLLSNLFAALTAILIGGCIFDSARPAVTDSRVFRTRGLDTVLSGNARPDRVVTLYQPLLDASLKPGASSAPEILTAVNIRDHASKQVLQYQVTRQRFGRWSAELEFKWNYFLLKGNFLWADSLPDTAGMAWQTQDFYNKVHPQDRFTNYFDSIAAPGILDKITNSTNPGAVGMAVKPSRSGDSVIIQQVVAGSPAGRAGLLAGMYILAVNDSPTVGDSALQRFQRFSPGDSGTQVKLTVMGNNVTTTYNLVREPVAFPTVMIDSLQGAGYISINGFTPNTIGSKSTYTEFRDALIATRKFPVTILDLRDNGGGSLDIALRMCDEIVPKETIIIRQLQRRYEEITHAPFTSEITAIGTSGGVGETGQDGNRRKYLLLGNHGSASAAEIFLISVKEAVGAPLMGIKTYGKGVGQTVRDTPGKGLALVTFLMFTSRANLEYHKIGLVPDILDSASTDDLLVHAVEKAASMTNQPMAKISAGARKDLSNRAAAIEWNRRQAIRRGVMELDGMVVP